MWDEPGEFPCLVSHQCPVINDLWLEGGCKQRAYQLALLWDNLHPTAIFFTKHQLTRLILHYKLGLPDPLGSLCGQNQKFPSDAWWKTGQWTSRNDAMLCREKKMHQSLFLIFNPKHLPFACVNIFRKPSHTRVRARWIAAINMNFHSFLSLSLFWLPAVSDHRNRRAKAKLVPTISVH